MTPDITDPCLGGGCSRPTCGHRRELSGIDESVWA